MKPIKVLIVDDSTLIRELLTSLLGMADDIHVVGAASDPIRAREMIKEFNPDVITLDIEMPKMDGLTFLEKIMTLRPTPVVMVSSLTQEGAEVNLKALELGAVDVFGKPTLELRKNFNKRIDELLTKIRVASKAHVIPLPKTKIEEVKIENLSGKIKSVEKVIVIGASTGGVEAIREIITALPANSPPILIVQHMPPNFTKTFAKRLNKISKVTVVEAQDDEPILPGHVYVAPGDRHLQISKAGKGYKCVLDDSDRVSGHKPSVDMLFRSASEVIGENCVAAILTGMGKDGAHGMLALRNSGAITIGQDEASSIVYGMPKAAFELGAVQCQLGLSKIPKELMKKCII